MRNFSYTLLLAFAMTFAFAIPAHAAIAKFEFESPSDKLTDVYGYAYAYRWDEDYEYWAYAGNAYADETGKIKIKDLKKGTYYFYVDGWGYYNINSYEQMYVSFDRVYYGGSGDWDTKEEVVLKGGTFFNGGTVSPNVQDVIVNYSTDTYYIPSDGGTQNITYRFLNLKNNKVKWKYWLAGYVTYEDPVQGYNSSYFPLTDSPQNITLPKGYSELEYAREIPANAPGGRSGYTRFSIGNHYYKPKEYSSSSYYKLDPSEELSPENMSKAPVSGEYTEEKIPFRISKDGTVLSEME